LLIKNGLSSKHSKHIKLHYYFICEKFTDGTIAAKYISTDKQLADGLTKALASIKYKKSVEGLSFVMSIRTLTIFFSFLLFYFIFSDFTFLFLYFIGKTMKKARDKEVT